MPIDLEFDKKHIWHPYTSLTSPLKVYPVASASGVILTLEDGTELIDGMSSWWAAIHGYNHPVINQAISSQLEKMSHVMFGGITHDPAVALSKLLIDLTPEPLDRVFLADSGSVCVEVAIKMAFQYWLSKGQPDKCRLMTVRKGYHGDTFFAMSVCDAVNGMHNLFKNVIPEHIFAPPPGPGFYESWDERHISELKDLMKHHHKNIAAVILEPVVQGAGGMRFYAPRYLEALRTLCDQYDILLIFDEIATGFGRTGKMFACMHAGITPDIICLGKALTGGYMTLSAALTTQKIAGIICQGESGVFMHGPTFMGNPLACVAAISSIGLLQTGEWEKQVTDIQTGLENGLSECRNFKRVKDVRVLGAIGVVELNSPVNVGLYQKHFVKKGVWIRPFGCLIYVMPPFIITWKQISILTKAISQTLYALDR